MLDRPGVLRCRLGPGQHPEVVGRVGQVGPGRDGLVAVAEAVQGGQQRRGQGGDDERVPSPQAVEMYRALRSNGVPTHLYIGPREPHGWSELRHQLFKMNVELDWFEKYARGREYRWETPPDGTPRPAPTTSSQQ